jgi:hypothetical protein
MVIEKVATATSFIAKELLMKIMPLTMAITYLIVILLM